MINKIHILPLSTLISPLLQLYPPLMNDLNDINGHIPQPAHINKDILY